MKQLLMLAIMVLFLILVTGRGQQASATPTPTVDHYKCYKAKGKAFDPVQTHTVDDQFEEDESDTIIKPKLICNPTQKTIDTTTTLITHPNSHLACYKVKGAHKLDSAVTVRVNNQFGTQDLAVAPKEKLLCVPSFKACLNDQGTPIACPNDD